MSIKAMTRVWDHSESSGTKLVTMLSLADRADDHGVSWPGYDDIAKRARIKRRQAIRTIHQLEELGEVWSKQHVNQTGRQTSNRYLVLPGLTLSKIEDILINHPQLQLSPEEANLEVQNIKRARETRGVRDDTPKGGRGVRDDTPGVYGMTPRGVRDDTPEGVPGDTRIQIRTHNEPKEKPSPPSEGAGAPANSQPASFQDWLELVQQPPNGSNCTAQLKLMHDTLFPTNDPATFGRLGATMKRVGGAGRLCQLLWEAAPKRPNGNVLDYIEGMERSKNHNRRKEAPGRQVHF